MADGAQGAAGGGFLGAVKSKLGPLPVWAWLAIVTVILLGWYLYEQHKGNTTGTTPTNQSAASVGQPGVVVINQDDADTNPAAPPPEPKPPKKGGPGPSPESPHKVTRAEAMSALKGNHTVYTRNRGGTYVPVTSLAGVHDQLFVGEQEWDRISSQKPAKK